MAFLVLFALNACSEQLSEARSDYKKTEYIPLAGNGYTEQANPGIVDLERGVDLWTDEDVEVNIYFYANKETPIQVGVRGKSVEKSTIEIEMNDHRKSVELHSKEAKSVLAGEFEITQPGYNKVVLRGLDKDGDQFARISDIYVTMPVDLELSYVENDENNRFYWGRRGPSVHLSYGDLPEGENLEWLYSELTVPEGYDPVGSYFMSNGFGEGYFGIQVNSDQERRVLFSVWSPYQTDNPDEIPVEKRIQVLDHGDHVYIGEFGNEGSGGQSFKVYNWKAGSTYRFLNSVQPDGEGNTIYTGYFYSPETKKWKLIARFLRPQTDTWYNRPHSFLENFAFENGHLERKAFYENQWIRTTEGKWHELNKAEFTGDDIAQIGYRLDYSGGIEDGRFFLRNGGFFDGETELHSHFDRPKLPTPPDIDSDNLKYYE
ncbi:MAG: DUF3472 domain-containing protein [Balneolaceae bacterium]|nr:DUF3472 domain-containing protein [Balneolaceae bacterium]MCH8548437.1 DUF3472 domain-containing protein [Balneolaceae bacterium]